MGRMKRADLPPAPLVVVTLSEGTDAVDGQVLRLAHAEAEREGLHIDAYAGILDDPDAGLLCHVFTATKRLTH